MASFARTMTTAKQAESSASLIIFPRREERGRRSSVPDGMEASVMGDFDAARSLFYGWSGVTISR